MLVCLLKSGNSDMTNFFSIHYQNLVNFTVKQVLEMFYSVEGEFIPIKGDEVTFQKILIPPKNESYQAVHVKITHLKEGEIHHRWDGSTVQ